MILASILFSLVSHAETSPEKELKLVPTISMVPTKVHKRDTPNPKIKEDPFTCVLANNRYAVHTFEDEQRCRDKGGSLRQRFGYNDMGPGVHDMPTPEVKSGVHELGDKHDRRVQEHAHFDPAEE